MCSFDACFALFKKNFLCLVKVKDPDTENMAVYESWRAADKGISVSSYYSQDPKVVC